MKVFGTARRCCVLLLLSLIVPAAALAGERPADAGHSPPSTIPLPPDEAIRKDPFLREALSRSSEGLEEVKLRDGSVMVDLQGRFQNISVARINDDGEVETTCVLDHGSLEAFLKAHPEADAHDYPVETTGERH